MKPRNNFAFIDAQNVYLSAQKMGWTMDFERLMVYLAERYDVARAYYFIGYLRRHERMYQRLGSYGYELVFKRTTLGDGGKVKGNCDAELVLRAMIDFDDYDQAVIVTSDGDFTCLVEHWRDTGKLFRVLAASRGGCARALRRAAGSRIDFVDDLRGKLELKRTP